MRYYLKYISKFWSSSTFFSRHKEALVHAKEGIKIAHFLVRDMFRMTQFYTTELLQKQPLEEVSIISNQNFSLLEKTSVKLVPVIKTVQKKMAYEDIHERPVSGPIQRMQPFYLYQGLNQFAPIDSENVHDFEPFAEEMDMKNVLGYLN